MYNFYQTTLPLDQPRANKYLYKCLWFISLTLDQKLFPNENIETEIFPSVLRQIVVWVFHPEILKVFLLLDPYTFFEQINKMFHSTPKEILLQKDENLLQYFQSEENHERILIKPDAQ
jgi:hypothetical protein